MHARTHRTGFVVGVFALAALMTSPAHAQQAAPPAQQPAPGAQQPAPGQPYYGQPQPTYYAQPAQQPYYAQPQPGYAQPQYAQPQSPPQTRTVSRPNIGLIVSGAVLLGVGWVTNIIFGLPAGDDPFHSGGAGPEWDAFRVTSIIPVAGPWIQLGVKPTGFGQDYWAPWLIINGLMQTAGLTMLVIGVATPRTVTVTAARSPGLQLALVPQISPNHVGAGLIGTF